MPFIISRVSNTITKEQEFTARVTKIFNEVLGIKPENIYIKYSDIVDWGVAGMNFDRNQYM